MSSLTKTHDRFVCLSSNITIIQIGHQQTTAMSRQVVGRDPPRVLLVDDSRNDLHAAARVLKSFDIRVTVVDDANIALQMLNMEPFVSMIVSKYELPDMNGCELLVEIKKSPILENIPVVIVSSEKDLDTVKKCLDAGAKDYVLKPIGPANLRRILHHLP